MHGTSRRRGQRARARHCSISLSQHSSADVTAGQTPNHSANRALVWGSAIRNSKRWGSCRTVQVLPDCDRLYQELAIRYSTAQKRVRSIVQASLHSPTEWARWVFCSNALIAFATVALPVAISHKASLKPKRCASATWIQKTSKNEPKHGPKNGTAWRSHFWDRMHTLVKEQKKSTFMVPFLGPSGGTKNETAKIAKSTAKADKQKMTTAFS